MSGTTKCLSVISLLFASLSIISSGPTNEAGDDGKLNKEVVN